MFEDSSLVPSGRRTIPVPTRRWRVVFVPLGAQPVELDPLVWRQHLPHVYEHQRSRFVQGRPNSFDAIRLLSDHDLVGVGLNQTGQFGFLRFEFVTLVPQIRQRGLKHALDAAGLVVAQRQGLLKFPPPRTGDERSGRLSMDGAGHSQHKQG